MRGKTCLMALALACGVSMILSAKTFAQDAPANAAGTWEMSMESPRGTNTQTATIQQDGAAVKGTLKGQRGETPFEGSVTGNKISFTVKRETPNGTFTIEYSGTIDGDSMTG